jgi:hypothetical protein
LNLQDHIEHERQIAPNSGMEKPPEDSKQQKDESLKGTEYAKLAGHVPEAKDPHVPPMSQDDDPLGDDFWFGIPKSKKRLEIGEVDRDPTRMLQISGRQLVVMWKAAKVDVAAKVGPLTAKEPRLADLFALSGSRT